MRQSKIVFIALILLILPQSMTSQNIPSSLADSVGLDQRIGEQVPLDLTFRNEFGADVSLREFFSDKPVILALVYYKCPMLCNQILNGMVEGFRSLQFTAGKEFEVVTVSIDPTETHQLAKLKKELYMEDLGQPEAAEGWHFLTGEEQQIKELARAIGYRYVYDPERDQYAHASGIVVATPTGILSRYMYGIQYPSRDLRFVLMDAADGKIGGAIQKLLLLCYEYDPMTGKYGLIVMNLLRIGGVVTVLVIGGFLIIMHRREKRKSKAMPDRGDQSHHSGNGQPTRSDHLESHENSAFRQRRTGMDDPGPGMRN